MDQAYNTLHKELGLARNTAGVQGQALSFQFKVLIGKNIMKRWISAVGLVNMILLWSIVLQARVGQSGWGDILPGLYSINS
jgi:hypothetical protein